MLRLSLFLLLCQALPAATDVLIRTLDGVWIEGSVTAKDAVLKRPQLVSMHNGAPASATEAATIASGIKAIQEKDRGERDQAVEDLSAIGLPALTPFLEAIADTDQHEPKPLYNLFNRLVPSGADQLDRNASLLRMANGQATRGSWPAGELKVTTKDGAKDLAWAQIRVIAIRQKSINRTVEVHSLRHSTQIEYLDTGVYLVGASAVNISASGFTRLSWKDDSWASGPGGLTKPGGNYKTNLVDGNPFGALLARIGAKGKVTFVGEKAALRETLPGRLLLAINDNAHWQNNLGSYTVNLVAVNAYDLGDAR